MDAINNTRARGTTRPERLAFADRLKALTHRDAASQSKIRATRRPSLGWLSSTWLAILLTAALIALGHEGRSYIASQRREMAQMVVQINAADKALCELQLRVQDYAKLTGAHHGKHRYDTDLAGRVRMVSDDLRSIMAKTGVTIKSGPVEPFHRL